MLVKMSYTKTISTFAYRNIFRRTSTFALAIGVAALYIDRGVDVMAEKIWQRCNEGYLWKDVKKRLKLE